MASDGKCGEKGIKCRAFHGPGMDFGVNAESIGPLLM